MLKLYDENRACCIVFLHAVSTSTTFSHLPFWKYHPKLSILWNACLIPKCFLAWYIKLINNPFIHTHFHCLRRSLLVKKYLYLLILSAINNWCFSFLSLPFFISFFHCWIYLTFHSQNVYNYNLINCKLHLTHLWKPSKQWETGL